MNIRTSYRHTLYASYLGYVTQAVVNNFVPLLLLTFQSTWGISLSRLATLVSVNFGIQLLVDLAGARFVDRIGYRPCIVTAHIMAGVGLICLGILPFCLPDPFVGILLSIMLYAVGGGLTEVLISPIVEACPTDHKDAAMSLLHSFYCWGHVFVILVSTAYFALFGIENWRYMSFAWAALPLLNAVYFSLVPLRRLDEAEGTAPLTIRQLLCRPVFWLFVVLMLCARAGDEPVVIRLCRAGTEYVWLAQRGYPQDALGSGRSLPVRLAHGNGAGRVRPPFAQARYAPDDAGLLRHLHGQLPACRACPLAACRTGWLRTVRAVGGHHVARDLQSVHPCVPRRRDRNVCFAGVGRGFRLYRRTVAGGQNGGGYRPVRTASGAGVPGTAVRRAVGLPHPTSGRRGEEVSA